MAIDTPDPARSAPASDPDRIRASNADREAVVRRLNDALSDGRIDLGELDDRVGAAYAAKTVAELRPLTCDLPPVSLGSARVPPQFPRAVGQARRRWVTVPLRYALIGLLGVVLLTVAIVGAASAWFVWIVLGVAFFGSRHRHHALAGARRGRGGAARRACRRDYYRDGRDYRAGRVD